MSRKESPTPITDILYEHLGHVADAVETISIDDNGGKTLEELRSAVLHVVADMRDVRDIELQAADWRRHCEERARHAKVDS